ncbi:MAG: 4-hydroxy-tetrahydrodipicolinate reductase [Bacteroidales bacterium]|nr:4-hydroxy-tetrahydrodipicolinate reductase [Bacteroidales bacterium]
MKIILSGYGRMGKEVENIALERHHTIAAIIDQPSDFVRQIDKIRQADVAIDFSLPSAAADNILRFFDVNIPIVVGTTGWQDRFQEIEQRCITEHKSLFWSSNMSLGVNLFFQLNRQLADLLHSYEHYTPSIEETHHIHKKDAPSGTALMLANDILPLYPKLSDWKLADGDLHADRLMIQSIRKGEVVGEHKVCYHSEIDEIEIRHTAFNRKGFALGAVVAAEWLHGKTGIFNMNDLLK